MMEYGVYTKIFRHFWQFSLIFNLYNQQMKQAKFKIETELKITAGEYRLLPLSVGGRLSPPPTLSLRS